MWVWYVLYRVLKAEWVCWQDCCCQKHILRLHILPACSDIRGFAIDWVMERTILGDLYRGQNKRVVRKARCGSDSFVEAIIPWWIAGQVEAAQLPCSAISESGTPGEFSGKKIYFMEGFYYVIWGWGVINVMTNSAVSWCEYLHCRTLLLVFNILWCSATTTILEQI